MGVYDRDYFREEETGPKLVVEGPVVWSYVGLLLAATVLLWFADARREMDEIYRMGGLQRDAIVEGRQYWRLLTYAMLPGAPIEAFVTVAALIVVGRKFEKRFGSLATAGVLFGGAVAASCTMVALHPPGAALPEALNLLGPTPALAALLIAAAVRLPFEEVVIYAPYRNTVELRLVAILFLAFGAASALAGDWRPARLPSFVAAAVAGYLASLWIVEPENRPNAPAPKRRRKRAERAERAERADRADRVEPRPTLAAAVGEHKPEPDLDGLLKKIGESGMESLTDSERVALQKASKSLRERRGP